MSQPVVIGAGSRIADRDGTHNPGEQVDYPSQALVDLATNATVDPETGEPYVVFVGSPPAKKDAPEPDAEEKT